MRSNVEQTPRDEPVDPPGADVTALYRFFDAERRLLYVGITDTTGMRWNHHRLHAAWWPQAVTKQVEWFTIREEAAAAELVAIRTESPLWNTAAAPASNRRLNVARFVTETNGGGQNAAGEWRNSDVAIVQTLAAEIRQGRFPAGTRLPSISTLSRRFGVGTNTARRAILLLMEDGLVVAQGQGTLRRYFVATDLDDSAWRPPLLPDGRDALDALLVELRDSGCDLSVASRRIGLHLSIVRGWGQRHPRVAQMMKQAQAEGRRRAFARRTGTGLKDTE